MPAIHFRNLSFQYSSAVPVISDASFSLGVGWTGVVGANGSGKTTVLRLIDATLVPTSGAVDIDPTGGIVVRCPQTADEIDENIAALADSWDGEAHALLGRLALNRDELGRWNTLSPGERKRWQIGGALYRQPDILLLDEPTNHLDASARDLLVEALNRYRGVGAVVSHDRELLNRLCSRTLRVAAGSVELWGGGYDTAHTAWEAGESAAVENLQRVNSERKKVERRLADKRRASATKEARHKKQLRQAGIKDKDARSMEKKGRFQGGQTQGARDMNLLRAEADRLRSVAEDHDVTRKLGGELFFDYEPARRSRLLAFSGPLRAGAELLAPDVDFSVDRDDRILLTGPNGAGKTTLLRALLDGSTLDESRILYLPQELTEGETRNLVRSVVALDSATKGRVLGIVAVLGSDPKRILATDLPSPGEARKLLIASGLGCGAWVLLLDEPTNHLDLPSIERLESALSAYPGATVVVTHDADFGRATTRTRWDLDSGRLREVALEDLRGGVDDEFPGSVG
ncbi:MAG: ABC-F family ATP-binding cassette domain-containing protein [bacterium]|nr:ABC-F family ATP-binding cassette domain-containing protein [bacterium]